MGIGVKGRGGREEEGVCGACVEGGVVDFGVLCSGEPCLLLGRFSLLSPTEFLIA